MNFKQVEIVGFKSFADATKIVFEEGINVIVGPNGCGKSNIADAVKWTLGEQSSKNIRGSSMQDVIFKGTEKRKGSNFCEVTLSFNNYNKVFNTSYDEFTVTRKLYKNGASEYLLNGHPCRLKEITAILFNSGIGKSGYSIIGQGMVDKIVSSKPIDRRVIFEEAAGIAGFKAKKQEAENNLNKTQINLDNINSIISEIDRQMHPLKKQSDTAKIFLDLKEQLKLLEINAYIYKTDNTKYEKDAIQNRINAIVEDLTHKQTALSQTVADYNQSYDIINNIDIELKKQNQEILDLTVGLEKFAGQSVLIKEKIKNLQAESNRYASEINRRVKLKEQMTSDLVKISGNKKYNEESLIQNRSLLIELEQKYKAINAELESGENEAAEAQKKLFDSLNKMSDVKAKISALKVEKQTYEDNFSNLTKTSEELKEKANEMVSLLNKSAQRLNSANSERDEYKDKTEKLIVEQSEKLATIKSLELDINESHSTIISLHQRKKILEEMKKEHEGFNGTVKRLLTDAENKNELKTKIVGVVASLIKVPAKFQIALEMALGSAVQNIVTNTEEDAKYLIKYLKEKEYGRTTFLPINKVKSRDIGGNFASIINSLSLGIAKDLVEYNPKIESVISSLLGSTVVVEDINDAIALANKTNYSFRIVTLDGDIISPQGSVTGGSKKAYVTNLLSRDSEIGEIVRVIEKLTRERAQLIENNNISHDEYDAITKELSQSTNAFHESEILYAKESEIYNGLVASKSELDNQKYKCESDLAKFSQMLVTIENELSRLDDGKQISSLELTDNQSQFIELKNQREEISSEILKVKLEINGLEKEITTFVSEIERLTLEQTLNNNELVNYESQCEEIKSELVANNQLSSEILSSKDTADKESALSKTKEELSKLEQNKSDIQIKLKQLDEDRSLLSTQVNNLQDKKYQQELNLAKVDTDIEQMEERIWEEYELTYATALNFKQEKFDLKQGLKDISKTKNEIFALGTVNVNAIEDYKLLVERHGKIYEQAQDLIKAEEDLKKVIKDLASEMTEQFLTEFNKINENFGKIFKELFNGGEARLELVDSDDVLEAGVEIYADPPEKKLKNTQLLSGGEKALVAIAILFAILRLKPMPFCLLDEIEAPLDEANVNRFLQYLKKYSHETQFILITHKKQTMENSDVLYGITMAEKGVSKVVSVKLSEAIKMAEVK